MSESALDRWFAEERKMYGKADYHFKEECLSSKLIAFYLRPFNPTYLYQYTTTRYPDTYYPGRKKGDEESMLATEYHENVHKWDRWKQGFRFTLGYAFPQLFALPFILAAVLLAGPWGWAGFGLLLALFHAGLVVLAAFAGEGKPDDDYVGAVPSTAARVGFFVLTGAGGLACLAGSIIGGGLLALLWLGAALFLSPWPLKSRWRRDAELRGYTASLYRVWLKYQSSWNEGWFEATLKSYARQFTGPAYFYMESNGQYVMDELRWQAARFRLNEPDFLKYWAWSRKPGWSNAEEAEPFRMISRFVKQGS